MSHSFLIFVHLQTVSHKHFSAAILDYIYFYWSGKASLYVKSPAIKISPLATAFPSHVFGNYLAASCHGVPTKFAS